MVARECNRFSVKGCYEDLWYLHFPNDFNDELLKAVQRLWVTSVPKKIVFGLRLLQNRLPNRLDCEDSLWTFLDAIPQIFDLGQIFAVPLNDALAETSHHPTFNFNIPGFCIIIFDPAVMSADFSPLWIPMHRGNFGVFSFLSLVLYLSDIHGTLSSMETIA